jgi:hypothetical protein
VILYESLRKTNIQHASRSLSFLWPPQRAPSTAKQEFASMFMQLSPLENLESLVICMRKEKEEEEPTPSRGIVSDVPSDALEHAKMVHTWAETHPRWKRQHAQDKPKIRNKCGGCAGFRTTFCTWNTVDGLGMAEDDDACSNYYPRPRLKTEKQFEKDVSKL